MTPFIKPADRLNAEPEQNAWHWFVYAMVVYFVAMGLAGANDEREAQRLSLEGFVNAHAAIVSCVGDGRECR